MQTDACDATEYAARMKGGDAALGSEGCKVERLIEILGQSLAEAVG